MAAPADDFDEISEAGSVESFDEFKEDAEWGRKAAPERPIKQLGSQTATKGDASDVAVGKSSLEGLATTQSDPTKETGAPTVVPVDKDTTLPPVSAVPKVLFARHPDFVNTGSLVKQIDLEAIQRTLLTGNERFDDHSWDAVKGDAPTLSSGKMLIPLDLIKTQRKANEQVIERYKSFQKRAWLAVSSHSRAELEDLITTKDRVLEQKRQMTDRYCRAGGDLTFQAMELQKTSRQIGVKRRRVRV